MSRNRHCLKSEAELDVARFANETLRRLVKRRPGLLDRDEAEKRSFVNARVIHQRAYTVVILNDTYVGVSKFNPKDEEQRATTGTAVATRRAVLDFLGMTQDHDLKDYDMKW